MKDPSKKRSLSLTLFVASPLIFGAVVIEVFTTCSFWGGAGSLTLVWRKIGLIRINRHILRWWGLPASPPKRRGGHLPLPFSSLDPYRDYSWWQVHADGLMSNFQKAGDVQTSAPFHMIIKKPSKKTVPRCASKTVSWSVPNQRSKSWGPTTIAAISPMWMPTRPFRQGRWKRPSATGREGGTGFGCVRWKFVALLRRDCSWRISHDSHLAKRASHQLNNKMPRSSGNQNPVRPW